MKTYSTNDKLNGDEPGVIPRWRLSSNTFLLMIFFFFFYQQTSFLPFQFLSLTILAPPLSTCSFTSVRISGSDSSTEKTILLLSFWSASLALSGSLFSALRRPGSPIPKSPRVSYTSSRRRGAPHHQPSSCREEVTRPKIGA